MRIIAIANQKGGVGKTTTTVNLAAALANKGRRVLVIDLDSQACASVWLTGNRAATNHGIYQVLVHKGDPHKEIIKTDFNVDVILASHMIAGLEIDLQQELHREHKLERALAKVKGQYDYALLDCPPALGLAALNAFIAADTLVVPIDCRIESYEATERLIATIRRIEEELERQFIIYALPTFLKRTRIAVQVTQVMAAEFPGKILPSIKENTRIAEAFGMRQPISAYDSASTGAMDYAEVATALELSYQ